MDDQSQTKTCPLCAEIIKAAAKVCPFCRAAQSQFSLLREQLSIVVPPLLFLTLLGFVCYLVFPEHLGSSGRNFTRHREDLRVVRTSLERLMKKTDFSLAGYVTNTGTYPWRVRELELRLLDPKGNLVDVRHSSISEPFVVPAGAEGAFRVALGEMVFTNSSIIHQVRVQEASDGNLPAKPE